MMLMVQWVSNRQEWQWSGGVCGGASAVEQAGVETKRQLQHQEKKYYNVHAVGACRITTKAILMWCNIFKNVDKMRGQRFTAHVSCNFPAKDPQRLNRAQRRNGASYRPRSSCQALLSP